MPVNENYNTVNFNTAAGRKPSLGELSDAVYAKNFEKARTLLERGADPDERAPMHRQIPPLILTIMQRGPLEMIELLLDHGADINITRNHDFTPLIQAVFDYQGDAARLLVKRGARLDLRNSFGVTAASLARSVSQYDIAAMIEQQAAHAAAADKQDLLRTHPRKLKIKPAKPAGEPDDI